ncbi:MAG: 30S ribosomal protein S3 [Candidatus Bathyarchaeota archaeon]|nr:30S ribosomal protein S3 [Candidatus Bathyarchaeota archaeon]
MSIVKRFISEAIKNAEIDEFLQKRLERAGYGGVNISKTPLGTHVVVYAMRPGIVIGRGGETIRELAAVLEQNFKVANPQISVSEIEVPELNAYVVASRITSALQKGIHFRRAGFWAVNQVMAAGALGVEIVISGKLRTERARFEKFRAGYFPRCGDPALKFTRKTEAHVQLKAGMLGVRVKIMPPDADFPDKIKILNELPPSLMEKEPEIEVEAKEPQKTEPQEQIVVVEEEKKPEPVAETQVTVKSKPEPKAKPESQPEPEAPKPESQPEPKAEPEPEAEAQTPEPTPAPEPAPAPEPEPEPKPTPEPTEEKPEEETQPPAETSQATEPKAEEAKE